MKQFNEGERHELDRMPFDRMFSTSHGDELCHATGWEVFHNGEWWDEFIDFDGEIHLGR